MRIVVHNVKNNEPEERVVNEPDTEIGNEIQAKYGIDIHMLSEDLKTQFVRAYCKKRIADAEFEQIASDINKAQKDSEIEIQAMELVVSTIFIPIIDPEFENRSKKLQQEIFDIVFEFYTIATSGLTEDLHGLLLITKRMINEAIRKNS